MKGFRQQARWRPARPGGPMLMLMLMLMLIAACDGAAPGAGDSQPPAGDAAVFELALPRPDSGSPPLDLPAVSYSGSFPAGSGELQGTLTVGGIERRVELYLPATRAAAPPLLLTFHGTHGDAREMIRASYAVELAQSEGVIIASPQARQLAQGDWDNHVAGDVYWQTFPQTAPADNPDLLLVQAIIAEARRAYGVDRQRIFVLGHSSGGFFAILTGLALRQQVAGFAANAAGLVRCDAVADCAFTGEGQRCEQLAGQPGYCACTGSEKPVAVPGSGPVRAAYLTHSTDDTAVSVGYSCALAESLQRAGYPLVLRLLDGNGHSIPYNLAQDAWDFLAQHPLPSQEM